MKLKGWLFFHIPHTRPGDITGCTNVGFEQFTLFKKEHRKLEKFAKVEAWSLDQSLQQGPKTECFNVQQDPAGVRGKERRHPIPKPRTVYILQRMK